MVDFPNGIINFGSMWRMATKVPSRVAFIRMKSHPDTILESNMIPFPVDICPGRPTNCRKPGWSCESPPWKLLKSVSNLWEHSPILTRISSECLLSPWVRFKICSIYLFYLCMSCPGDLATIFKTQSESPNSLLFLFSHPQLSFQGHSLFIPWSLSGNSLRDHPCIT